MVDGTHCNSRCVTLHDSANLSNHSPIFSKLDVGKMDLGLNHYARTSQVAWKKDNDDEKDNFKKHSEINPKL